MDPHESRSSINRVLCGKLLGDVISSTDCSDQNTKDAVESNSPNQLANEEAETEENMPIEEIHELSCDVGDLTMPRIYEVHRIVKQREPSMLIPDADGNVELDFETLKGSTLRAIKKYVDECFGRISSN